MNTKSGMLAGIPSEISLALALHNARGTYAAFLGSGVSRAAEIPTGWEVTLNMVKHLASGIGEEEGTFDPETWYRTKYDHNPNYSVLLEKLAPTQHQRRDLLQHYFEPSEDDLEEGRKLPTKAHHAVARLAAKGCIKVILTTNFDRLIERALQQVGVSPVVISSEDDVKGMTPLQHAGVTLVKANGDYLDTRIKNTPEELASYPPGIAHLLDRIFDEYGLVISGWSSTSDTALLNALRGTRSRRYMLYWAERSVPTEDVRELVSNLQGVIIEGKDANDLFTDLQERVEALELLGSGDPITAKVAVQRVKRYLENEQRYVRLRELVVSKGRETKERLFDEAAFPLNWYPGGADSSTYEQDVSKELRRRILSYDQTCETTEGIMAAGGYYAVGRQPRAVGELLEIVATPSETATMEPFQSHWKELQLYPALRLLYAGGVAATAASNWQALKAILKDTRVSDIYGTHPLVFKVYPWAVDNVKRGNALFDNGRYYEPIPEWLHKTLRGPLEEYLPLDFRYEEAFHRFEALQSLVYVDIAKKVDEHTRRHSKGWVPLGRFAVVHAESSGSSAYTQLRAEYDEAKHNWEPIRSGLLSQPAPSEGRTTNHIDTVAYNFEVVDKMMGKMSYGW